MRSLASVAIFAGLFVSTTATRVAAQTTHRITIESDGRDVNRFSPAEVKAKPGDVIVFQTKSGSPHSIVFEARGIPAAGREALNGAMTGRSGDLSSPLLTKDGMQYRIVLPADLAPGSYAYYCLPHRAYDERGRIIVSR